FKLGIGLLLYTIVIYHLTKYDNFPLSDNYRFPASSIFVSYVTSLILVVFVEWRFRLIFRKNSAKEGVTLFLKTISVCTIIGFIITVLISGYGKWNLYYIIISFLMTTVSGLCWTGFIYGKDLVLKWTKLADPNSISIKSGQTLYKVSFNDITHFTSVNRIVIAHLKSGKQIVTNFSLAELEGLLPGNFFRINRQFILNRNTIEEVKSIENQRLEVLAKRLKSEGSLVVSRYRASEFKKWIA
ncbi:MAG: LytTR family DNA-binding domain-containing protein, partial [Cyclobacteriaceae bacterium]